MNIAEIMEAVRGKADPGQATVLNVMDPDQCCSKRFAKEARTGSLDTAEAWICPKCGVEYKPVMVGETMRHWTPHIYVELISKR